MPDLIRLMIVDDQQMVRESLGDLLSLEDDIEVVGEAADGNLAIEQALLLSPDIILMDVRMPNCNGVEATREILTKLTDTRVIMLTTFDEEEYIIDSLEAGASGYLLKDTASDDLAAAIRVVRGGNTQLGPSIAPKVLARLRVPQKKLQAEKQELERLTQIDPLTDLPNRRGLEKALTGAFISATAKTATCAVLVDLDDFKAINEEHGHVGGDEVLKQMGRRIQNALRLSDTVARIGGDEFVILLPQTEPAEAHRIAERARLALIEKPFRVGTNDVIATASFGIAEMPGETPTLEDVLSLTKFALKRSKSLGKNRISGSGDDIEQSVSDEMADFVERLRDGSGLRVFAQPICKLSDKSIDAYEFSSRGPAGPFELPSDFFRLAAENDMLTQVDLTCLKKCVAAASDHSGANFMHFNVHPSTLLEMPVQAISNMLTKVAGKAVPCVQVRESLLMGDVNRVNDRLTELRNGGVQIAIDHIGTGKTCLETLLLINPDIAKLDPQLIRGISASEERSVVLKRLVNMLRGNGAKIIAEGIESEEDLACLSAMSIEYGQGLLFGALNDCHANRAGK